MTDLNPYEDALAEVITAVHSSTENLGEVRITAIGDPYEVQLTTPLGVKVDVRVRLADEHTPEPLETAGA
jgi:hypothetical protein